MTTDVDSTSEIGRETDKSNSSAETATLAPPPDGGFHAWAQVVSGHFVVALTWGYASSFGVFQNYYEATLPQTASDISWIGGFQVFCLLFMSMLSGHATDAGLARLVVGAGAVFLLLGTFMTSLATTYWQIFLAQGLCIGIGQGLMWLPSVTLISTYFVRLRVLAVTAAATGTSTGGIIFPAMIQYLTPQIGRFTYIHNIVGVFS
jgi:MFS family permease